MTDDEMTDDLELSVEEDLSSVTADFLSMPDYELDMVCLFDRPFGQWMCLTDLRRTDGELWDRIRELEEAVDGRVLVAWMEYPAFLNGDDDYVTVHFFVESILWWTTAVYNKGRLMESVRVSGREYGDD